MTATRRRPKKGGARGPGAEVQGAEVDGRLGVAAPKSDKLAKYLQLCQLPLEQKKCTQRQMQGSWTFCTFQLHPELGRWALRSGHPRCRASNWRGFAFLLFLREWTSGWRCLEQSLLQIPRLREVTPPPRPAVLLRRFYCCVVTRERLRFQLLLCIGPYRTI